MSQSRQIRETFLARARQYLQLTDPLNSGRTAATPRAAALTGNPEA